MPKFSLPIRQKVPIIIFVLFGLFAISNLLSELRYAEKKNEKNLSSEAFFEGAELVGILEDLLQKGDINRAKNVLSREGGHSNLNLALLVDENNVVILSTKYNHIGSRLEKIKTSANIEIVKNLLKNNSSHQLFTENRSTYQLYFPVKLGLRGGELRARHIGMFFTEHDLSVEKSLVRSEALNKFYTFSVLLTIICIGFLQYFKFTVSDRIIELEEVSRAIAYGDFSASVKAVGNDELSHLGRSFNKMIEKRKQADEKVSWLSRIIEDSLNEIYIFDSETLKFVKVNRGARENLGYTMEELMQLTPIDLKPEYTEKTFTELIAPLMRGKSELMTFTTVHKRKDGSLYPVEISLQFYRTEKPPVFVAIIQDISNRKQTEDELQESEKFLQDVFDGIQDGISVLDKDLNIVRVNRTMEKWFSHVNLCGKKCFDAYHERSKQCDICPAIRTIETGKIQTDIVPLTMPDGVKRWLEIHSFPMKDDDGKITGVIEYLRDITRLKKQQKQMLVANKLESLGIVAAGVAHEINNPNCFIMTNAEALQEICSDAMPVLEKYFKENGDFGMGGIPYSKARGKLSGVISNISEGSYRINAIVNKLKHFSRKDEGIKREEDINKIVEKSVEFLKYVLKKSSRNFLVENGRNLPGVKANTFELGQVIINLLVNACQSLPDKNKKIIIKTGYNSSSNNVIIEVIDEGKGIEPDNIEKIIEPFFTTKQETGGTGLGLSTSFNIVKDHKGTLEFYSELGKGTTAVVKIPAVSNGRTRHKGSRHGGGE